MPENCNVLTTTDIILIIINTTGSICSLTGISFLIFFNKKRVFFKHFLSHFVAIIFTLSISTIVTSLVVTFTAISMVLIGKESETGTFIILSIIITIVILGIYSLPAMWIYLAVKRKAFKMLNGEI